MENKNYNNQNKEKLSKLWGKVGFVVNLSQMIEYNLANILAADEVLRNFENSESVAAFEYNEFVEESNKWDEKLLNKPMGVIINRAKQVSFFTEDSVEKLRDVLERRNEIVHQLFKKDLKLKHLETDPDLYFDYLEESVKLFNDVNNDLSEIFNNQK